MDLLRHYPGIQGSRGSKGKLRSAFTRSSLVSALTSPRTTIHEKMPLSPISPLKGEEHATLYSDKPGVDMHPELAGTLQDVTPELSSDASFNGRAELADPERLLINSPKTSNSSPTESNHTEASSAGYNGSGMGSNLNTAKNTQSTTGASARRADRHVMSWLDYNGDAGPQR